MKKWSRAAGAAVALAGGAASVSFAMAGSATAAQSTMPLTCDGTQYLLRTNSNNSGNNGGWGVAQLVDKSGHLIPTSFNYSLVDTAPGSTFSYSQTGPKGQGNANANQRQVSCSSSFDSTLGAEAPPSFDYAGTGTAPTDPVTVTITVTAVPKVKG
jgi:hypothetical protein